MKNKTNNITKIARLMLGLTTIAIAAAVLCLAPSSASGKPSHGGGSGGGLPYATASTVSQLIADLNYANQVGGAITINLAAGTTFDLKSADNTTDGGNGLPVIGGTKAVALTIIGNGATINRIAVIDRRYSFVKNPFRFFDVAPGASLTLDQVTLKGGWSSWSSSDGGGNAGGGVLNHGTLNIINGCTFSGNTADDGADIYNVGGTVIVSDSTLSGYRALYNGGGIYNAGGTVIVSSSTLSGFSIHNAGGGIYNVGGTVIVSSSTLSGSARFGGGIYNSGGTVTMSNGSTLSHSLAYHSDYPWAGGDGGGLYNDGGTVTINNSTVSGNIADANFGTGGGIYNHGGAVASSSHFDFSGSPGPVWTD